MSIGLPVDIANSPYLKREHHQGDGFRNPPGSAHPRDGRYSMEMLSLLAELAIGGNRPFDYPETHVLARNAAVPGLQSTTPAITWLGQAAFYLQLGSLNVVTDPFLSHRASPFSFSGPKRLVPAPLRLNDLPRLDVIVLSHNHYDHLDLQALKRWPDKAVAVVVPLGVGPLMRKIGYSQVVEMDWYQEVALDGAVLTCLPAYHFSGRSIGDSNKTLWSSFAIKTPQASVYFTGDSGYGSEFKRIGELLGPFDVGLMPIGAYAPRNVMARVHMNPEEAVLAGQDIGAKVIVPMHWGTIRLTNEPMWEPSYRFHRALQESGAAGQQFAVGETRTIEALHSVI
ncbi:MAG: MBL fold metallo-hydrolase [Pseudomonadales bacterium]|nr:MBL fold metallo-hydrolase [Pseudomonadales bacterium]